MANSLGYYILSPARFSVHWDGDVEHDAGIEVLEGAASAQVDGHAAFGSFTVQPGFIPMTDRAGDFLYIKGVPNERGRPFQCMEALIEAWWNPAPFGLVFLLNRVGSFTIDRGEPLAQMFVYQAEGGDAPLATVEGAPEEFGAWEHRRYRPGYAKDLDYLQGRHPDGWLEPSHRTAWRRPNPGR